MVLAFLPDPPTAQEPGKAGRSHSPSNGFEAELASIGGISIGIMSATQGQYTTAQLLLDITQGARISSSAYEHLRAPAMSLVAMGAGARVSGWAAARRRAEDAPQLLRPGLLASTIPTGAAYAAIGASGDIDGVASADERGLIAGYSLGPASTLLSRIASLGRLSQLVVADLPGGPAGLEDLRALSESRTRDRLLIVLERPSAELVHQLLWVGIAGLAGGGGRELSSQTTNERGLIASVDIAPTILARLHLARPADMRGFPMRTDGALDSASLRGELSRLGVIGHRRLRALGFLLCALVLLLAVAAARPGIRARALRAGGLAVLWAPVAVLIPAALEPSAPVEYAIIVLACLALGALTDRLLPWPRAPLLPALVAVCVLVADSLAGTQLLERSLLGPDPALGARFYGIGNELKSGLAVLAFAAVASALYPSARGRRAAAAMAATGILLAAVEGSGRIGAGVGGVILVSAGAAVATTLLLARPAADLRPLGGRAALVILSPIAGLLALALLDLLTAHGSGHFTGSILHVRSAADVRDIIVRRYSAAFKELGNHAMPVATALALLISARAVAGRVHLLAPVGSDPAWAAALTGGLTAGAVGALSEDSGPVLFVVAVFTLGCVLAYLWGRPPSHSAQAPWSTTSCSETVMPTRSVSRSIARSRAGSEKGVTRPQASHTR